MNQHLADSSDEYDLDDSEDEDDDLTYPCPRCGESIFDEAERCPECGSYISQEDRTRRLPLWISIGVLMCVGAVLAWVLRH